MFQILLILISGILVINAQLIIETQYGPIRGAEKISQLNKTYYSFQKIPYMRPPLNSYRFRDPVPPEPWTEPLDCTQEGPRFPQVDYTWEFTRNGTFHGDLDSMHINVFTNNLKPNVKYAVLIWFHGGIFRSGSGISLVHGPDYLMERDVILVTFNSRLHVFGFVSFDDPELGIPGNAGFRDQIMAMKWVKANIENFGGDPNKITIGGQLTGGRTVHYHTISPASKDLFQRAIILSGTVFLPGNAVIPRRNWAFRIAKAVGYEGPEVDREILAFLETADPRDLFFAVYRMLDYQEEFVEQLQTPFGPVIEPYDNGNAFLLQYPGDLLKDSWGNNLDFLLGGNSFEGGVITSFLYSDPTGSAGFFNFPNYVPYQLNFTDEVRNMYAEKMKITYFGQVEPTLISIEPLAVAVGDYGTWNSYDQLILQRLRDNPKAKNWFYRFDANSDNNYYRARSGLPESYFPYRRAIAQDDIGHLFKTSFAEVPERDSKEFKLIEHMLDIFTNFIATGDPGVENWKPTTDPEFTLSGYNIREEKNLSTFGTFPEMAHMGVWREIYAHNDPMPSTDDSSRVFISATLLALSKLLHALM